jgi:hypothetical protein
MAEYNERRSGKAESDRPGIGEGAFLQPQRAAEDSRFQIQMLADDRTAQLNPFRVDWPLSLGEQMA